jgi:hypothetical protein
MISYRSAGPAPQKGELVVDVDASTYRLWRGASSPVVGAFAGSVNDGDRRRLGELADACTGAGSLDVPPPQGAVLVTMGVDGVRCVFGEGAPPDGPWGALAAALDEPFRTWRDEPHAAVALAIDEDGTSASLVHRGAGTIAVDVDGGEVHVVRWQGYYEPAGSWRARLNGGRVEATPGWSRSLPFDHRLPGGPGLTLHVYVTFSLDHDGVFEPVQAVSAPPVPEDAA